MPVPGSALAQGRLILTADVLVDGSGAPAIGRPAVTIADGRIVAVEQRSDGWMPPMDVELIDAPGMTLLPGLIDAHVHLAFPDRDAPLDRELLVLGAAERARAALSGGVTTVRDLGSAEGAALLARDEVAAGRSAGPRILAAGRPITTASGHCHWFGRLANDGRELLAAVDDMADAGADVIKVMETGGMLTTGSNPYATQYTVEQLAPAVGRAHQLGLRVAAHALCTAGVRTAIAAGVDTIEHGWTITGGAQDFEPAVAGEVARSGAYGSVSAHAALRDLLPDQEGRGGNLAELQRRLVPHRALAAAGVPMLVHSDAGPGPTRFEAFATSVRVYEIGMGTSPAEAIAAATGRPAAALGLGDILGSVLPGRLADIIVVEGDASRDVQAVGRVRRVLMGGRTVVVDGRILPPAG